MTYTDFTKYSHADLRKMAQALDPGAVMAAGDPWRKAATTLKEIRKTLTNASTEAATTWEGTTSDSFHTSMLTLAANINEAAAYANDAANTLHNMSEAMATAKRTMPEEPGTWDQFKDKVGDFFSSEDDHIQLTDQKKAEAAAVMQTLAMHYRIATPALKAPSLPGSKSPAKPGTIDDVRDVGSQDQSGAAMAAAAMISGTSFGTAGTSQRVTSGPAPRRSTVSAPSTVDRYASRSTPALTDSGIKGGTAQASTVRSRNPDAGISGTPVSRPSGSIPSPVTSGTQTSGLSTAPPVGPTSGPITAGGGQAVINPPGVAGPSGLGMGAREFLGGATPAEGAGPGTGRATSGKVYPGTGVGGRAMPGAEQAGGSAARPGGAVREPLPPGAGARGRQAFTEGGSGLGARNRVGVELGTGGSGAMAPGMPMSAAQHRKKERGKNGERPDYLVEDEETWASDKPANPNVVK
ncbi:hypothetical protein AB0F71_27000 [Kitasatospora sp. NPDC028055]|uniref:hypothetical protein n=1 Tax=Kitasatospora sp. NPDC028055 TaxID=3155653 RepID=UPI0033C9E72A